MKIIERIWLIIFTSFELMTPFLCYFRKESFSYEGLLLAVPLGMAFLYICLFGIKRPFETDVTELGVFQIYLIIAEIVIFAIFLRNMPLAELKEKGVILFFLGIGALFTLIIEDVIFALIFLMLGKLFGLESMFSKQRKENEQFYKNDSEPYEGYKNIYEKMYWEELERRQREGFKKSRNSYSKQDKKTETKHNKQKNWENNWEYKQKEDKVQETFLFEHTVYFKFISRFDQVRPRYISLMKQYHPDMKGGSTKICQEIQNEYDTICKEHGL